MRSKPYAIRAAAALLASIILAAGCGSMPERHETLEQARSLTQSLENDPIADRVARDQLAAARNALELADESLEDGEEEDLDYHAQVALRNAQIAEQLVATQQARAELEDAEAERARVLLQARERDAEAATQEAQEARAAAERAVSTAEQRAAELERATEAAQAERERAAELEAQLDELQAEETERGLVLTLGDVLFEVDEAELQAGAAATIDRLSRFLEEYPDRRIIVEGHTDATGPAEYNERLSAERANAVRTALLERGVAPDRIEVRGLGEAYPVASNDSSAGRQLNRRVEIVISEGGGQFQPDAERTVRAAPATEREG